jgi:Ni/Co efflux regulator RcnB
MKRKLAASVLVLGTMMVVPRAPGRALLAQDHQQEHGNEHGNQQSNDRRDQGQDHRNEHGNQQGNDRRDQGQANHRDQGQANYRNQGSSYHFRQEDAPRLRQQYSRMDRVDRDRRPHYSAGQHLPAGWNQRIRPVPTSVYRQLPPPPPGYRMGYLDGYAVAYNPTTQIIADVLDLVVAASGR